jgi:hypothetical protein
MSRSRPSGKAGVGVQGRKAIPGDDVTPVMGRPPEPPAPSTLVIHVRGSPRLSRYGAAGDPVLDDRHEHGQLGDEAIDFPWPCRIRFMKPVGYHLEQSADGGDRQYVIVNIVSARAVAARLVTAPKSRDERRRPAAVLSPLGLDSR